IAAMMLTRMAGPQSRHENGGREPAAPSKGERGNPRGAMLSRPGWGGREPRGRVGARKHDEPSRVPSMPLPPPPPRWHGTRLQGRESMAPTTTVHSARPCLALRARGVLRRRGAAGAGGCMWGRETQRRKALFLLDLRRNFSFTPFGNETERQSPYPHF